MIVGCDRNRLLRLLLPDDILIQLRLQKVRRRNVVRGENRLRALLLFLLNLRLRISSEAAEDITQIYEADRRLSAVLFFLVPGRLLLRRFLFIRLFFRSFCFPGSSCFGQLRTRIRAFALLRNAIQKAHEIRNIRHHSLRDLVHKLLIIHRACSVNHVLHAARADAQSARHIYQASRILLRAMADRAVTNVRAAILLLIMILIVVKVTQ